MIIEQKSFISIIGNTKVSALLSAKVVGMRERCPGTKLNFLRMRLPRNAIRSSERDHQLVAAIFMLHFKLHTYHHPPLPTDPISSESSARQPHFIR
jgi:hypothetical protein